MVTFLDMSGDEGTAKTLASDEAVRSGTEDTVVGEPHTTAALASAATMHSGEASPLPTMPDKLPEVPDEVYVRLDEFARGGLGRIVRARDERTGRIVAIKEMLGDRDEAAVRFVREAIITANLQHPAIVPVYEVGRWPNGQPFYAMKLVRGRPLNVVIEECKDLDARLALVPHVIAVADALAYAHGERVIHRDLKPHNVLVGAHGETVVIDWGLARRLGDTEASLPRVSHAAVEGATIVGAVLGTPSFMAPEQARGERVDERADVYAIGAMLYQALSGKPPFGGKTVEEVIDRVKTEPPRPLRQLVPAAPPDLAAIIERAMQRDMAARYPSAAELASDLRRFANGQLVLAHRYTRAQRLRRFARRHRAPIAVAAAALATLATFGTISIHDVIVSRETARAEKRDADRSRDEATRQREQATERLRTAYLDRARVELTTDHADRALPLVAAAADLGADDAATRFMVARALDDLPDIRRHPGAFIGGALVPGSADVIVCGNAGIDRWSPELDRLVWHVDHPAGDVMIARPDLAAGLGDDGLLLASLADGHVETTLPPPAGAKMLGLLGSDAAGRWFAAPTHDNRVALWDVSARALVATIPIAGVDHAPFLSPDGQHLLLKIAPDSRSAYYALFDRQGQQLVRLCEQCRIAAATGDAFAVTGRTKSTTPSQIVLADWSGRTLAQLETMTTSDVNDLALSPSLIAITAHDGSVEVFDRATHALRWRAMVSGQGYEVRFDRAGRLWVLTEYGGVYAFDVATSVLLAHYPSGGGGWLDITDDAHAVATIVPAGEARAWSIGRGARRAIAPTAARLRRVAYTADGSLFAASEDGTLTRYDRDGEEQWRVAAHGQRIASLQLVDAQTVLTSSRDGTTALWDAATHHELRRFTSGPYAEASPDGRTVAILEIDGTLALWDRGGATRLRALGKLAKGGGGVHWSPDGRVVAAIDDEGAVTIWDAATGSIVRKLDSAGNALDLVMSPDSYWFVREVEHGAGVLRALHAEPDRPLIDAPDALVFAATFSSDGKLVALAGAGFVGLWEVATGKPRMVARVDSAATGVAFAPGNSLLYTIAIDHHVHVWDVASGQPIFDVSAPQEAYWLAVAPDGQHVAIATLTSGLALDLTTRAIAPEQLHQAVACRTDWQVDAAGRLVEHAIDVAACRARPSAR